MDLVLDLLQHSDSSAVFCSEEHYKNLRAYQSEHFIAENPDFELFRLDEMDDSIEQGRQLRLEGNKAYDAIVIDAAKPAAIFYTSGTAGQSKGVMLTHTNIVSVINANREKYIAKARTLSVLPFHHAFGLVVAILFVFNEEKSSFINTQLKSIIDDFKESSPHAIAIVPMFLVFFYKRIWGGIRKQKATRKFAFALKLSGLLLKLGIDVRRKLFKDIHNQLGGNLVEMICGGAPPNPEHIKFFSQIGITVINGYGLTEASPVVATEKLLETRMGSCGTPLSCNTVRIAEDGEIFVKGSNIFAGYYKDEKATADVLFEGEFATGDLGHLDKDGYLFVTGRKKNLIILSNGENVSPEEIEQVLERDDAVAEVVVLEKNDRLVAYVFPVEEYLGNTEYFKQLKDSYNKEARRYRLLSEIILRDQEFEKNSSRKILRHKIVVD